MNIEISENLIFTNKPAGINTHATAPHQPGFTEWLQEKLKTKLFLFQRLDKETSGLLIFAKNSETAAQMTQDLKDKKVSKTYLFVTDRKFTQNKITIQGDIVKSKGNWVIDPETIASNKKKETECITHFECLNSFKQYSLWQAKPESGKPHQIRVHALEAGIPILGDIEHQGTPFIRLCLHNFKTQSLNPELSFTKESPAPSFFNHLEELNDPFYCQLECAWHKRQMAYEIKSDSMRWVHNEIENLKIDVYNKTCWIYDYGFINESHQADKIKNTIQKFLQSKGEYSYFIREMKNRGNSPIQSNFESFNTTKTDWLNSENGILFEMRSQQGLSPGLFLDQKENRNWIKENSKNKKVLNLFSYTGGFSVAAAIGGASEVTTVDVSEVFIDWSRKNFTINNLPVGKYEFWSTDVRIFLQGCAKRKRSFDIIVCDPPSFSRSKNNIFKIQDEAANLLSSMFEILNPNGIILFSTNYENWDQFKFQNMALAKIPAHKIEIINPPYLSLDFEYPNQSALLKTIILRKK